MESCPKCGYEFEPGEEGYEWRMDYICGECLREELKDLPIGAVAAMIGSDAKLMVAHDLLDE